VIVAGPGDAAVVRHLGFEVAESVEEAVRRAEALHGPDCAIGYIEQPSAAALGAPVVPLVS
jgi:hypothetical protein